MEGSLGLEDITTVNALRMQRSRDKIHNVCNFAL
jgi:hypothetical protein